MTRRKLPIGLFVLLVVVGLISIPYFHLTRPPPDVQSPLRQVGKTNWPLAQGISWSPDGRYLATTRYVSQKAGSEVYVWDLERKREVAAKGHKFFAAENIQFALGGKALVATGLLEFPDGTAFGLWRFSTSEKIEWFDGPFSDDMLTNPRNKREYNVAKRLIVTPDGKYVYAYFLGPKLLVIRYDLTTRAQKVVYEAETNQISMEFDISRDGNVLALWDYHKGIEIIWLDGSRPVQMIPYKIKNPFALSPDGKQLAFIGGWPFDPMTGEILEKPETKGLRIWNLDDEKLVRNYPNARFATYFDNSLSWSGDGKWLTGPTLDNTIVIFNTRSDERREIANFSGRAIFGLLRRYPAARVATFSPDSKKIAVGGSSKTTILSLD